MDAKPELEIYADEVARMRPFLPKIEVLRDMQRHPFKQQIMHLDFQRIDENEAIRFNVPLHFLNQDTSPAGKTAGVVVLHELNEIGVSCLPRDLPEFIEVDLKTLAAGHSIHLKDVALPTGVRAVTPRG